MKNSLLTVCFTLACVSGFSAGYQLNLQGLRQLAMGGTGTACPWDASTIFYNPGGLSRLDGIQAYASVLAIMPQEEYAPTVGLNSQKVYTLPQTYVPFNIYVGGPLTHDSRFGIGLGIYTPFGSGIKWNNDWTGRYMVQQVKLSTVFIQPTASYKINDVLSAGVGLIYATGNFHLTQALPISDQSGADGRASLNGSGYGLGFNVGLQINASDKWQFGITYRSRVNMKLDAGTASFNVPSSLQSYFPASGFTSSLPLPEVASIGVAWKATEKLTVQADVNLTGWRAFDTLRFDFTKQNALLQNEHLPRRYHNTVALRLGGHYDLGKVSLMAGVAYDPTPVADNYVSPDLPDGDRIVLTGGLSYRPIQRIAILAAMEYTSTFKRTAYYEYSNFGGQYQTKAVTPGIGVTYDF